MLFVMLLKDLFTFEIKILRCCKMNLLHFFAHKMLVLLKMNKIIQNILSLQLY